MNNFNFKIILIVKCSKYKIVNYYKNQQNDRNLIKISTKTTKEK